MRPILPIFVPASLSVSANSMRNSVFIRAFVVFSLSLLTSCLPVHYCRVEPVEARAELNEKGTIPQSGGFIKLSLELIEEKTSFTKTQPGYSGKFYRYRVFLDGELYSTQTFGMCPPPEVAEIPIMANDSYATRSVLVEGACAKDYESEASWDSWETLFEGTQDCLAEGDQPRYSGLDNKRLRIDVEDYTLYCSFYPGFSSEAFKRMLYDNPHFECPCILASSYISYHADSFSSIPCNPVSGIIEKGTLGIDSLLLIDLPYTFSVFTPIGTICEESKETLQQIQEQEFVRQHIKGATIHFSLCD